MTNNTGISGEILQKMVSMYPLFSFAIVFIFFIFQVSNYTTLSRSIRAWQIGIRILRYPASFQMKISHTMFEKRRKQLWRNWNRLHLTLFKWNEKCWWLLSIWKTVIWTWVSYSNAEEEKILSMARENKTCFRLNKA